MIATNTTQNLPLVVIVSDDSSRFKNLQRGLASRCLFFSCDNKSAISRLARDELICGWLIDAAKPQAISIADEIAQIGIGHRMVVVDSNCDTEMEIAAYQTGSFYACGELSLEWLVAFLGMEESGRQTVSDDSELVSS